MYNARSLGLTITKGSGGEDLVLCPFHSDTRPSAWFSEKKGLFYCAVCNLGLNVVQLMERMGLDPSEVENVGYDFLPDFDLMVEHDTELLDLPFYHPYYAKRGVNEIIFQEHDLRWRHRSPQAAVLPIKNYFGDIVGTCCRYVNVQESGTRYKMFGEVTPLWPMDKMKGLRGEGILIFEGAFSTLRVASFLAQFNLEGQCFSLLGAKANKDIADTVRRLKPIFLYDNDFAGQRACRKMRELLPLAPCYTLNKSPDDMSDEELGKLFDKLMRKVAA